MEYKINKKENNKDEIFDIKNKVFELIDKEKIRPTSKAYFSIKDKAFWSLFVLSILIGSVAFSVMIFALTSSEFDLYNITHDSVLDFMLVMTPYLWVLIFATFAIVGYENLRHTKNGYKYPLGLIIVVSLSINIAGGLTLHYFGMSKVIDEQMSFDRPLFRSIKDSKRLDWNQPDRGIISGEVISFNENDSTFVLKDFNGKTWTISSEYIPEVNLDSISVSSNVRVVGNFDGVKSNGIAVACYVLPWDKDEYSSNINSVKSYFMDTDDYERNISIERNNRCKAIKPYNIIKELINEK